MVVQPGETRSKIARSSAMNFLLEFTRSMEVVKKKGFAMMCKRQFLAYQKYTEGRSEKVIIGITIHPSNSIHL